MVKLLSNMKTVWNEILSSAAVFSSSAPRQFEFVQMRMNCTDAQRYCRDNYSDLASIDNSADVTQLLKSVNGASGVSRVWIGLMDTFRSEWKWSLGDPVFYTAHDSVFRNWALNRPNNGQYYCTYMGQDGLWHDDYCTNQRFFICYNGESITHNRNYLNSTGKRLTKNYKFILSHFHNCNKPHFATGRFVYENVINCIWEK